MQRPIVTVVVAFLCLTPRIAAEYCNICGTWNGLNNTIGNPTGIVTVADDTSDTTCAELQTFVDNNPDVIDDTVCLVEIPLLVANTCECTTADGQLVADLFTPFPTTAAPSPSLTTSPTDAPTTTTVATDRPTTATPTEMDASMPPTVTPSASPQIAVSEAPTASFSEVPTMDASLLPSGMPVVVPRSEAPTEVVVTTQNPTNPPTLASSTTSPTDEPSGQQEASPTQSPTEPPVETTMPPTMPTFTTPQTEQPTTASTSGATTTIHDSSSMMLLVVGMLLIQTFL